MKILTFAMLIILTCCCEQIPQASHNQSNYPWTPIANDIYDNEIAKRVFQQLNKEEQLHVCESGWGLRGMKKIKVMHCGFDYYYEIRLDEARRLLVKVIDLYLKAINANEKIRPYICNYPFTAENIEIRIFLYNSDGSLLSPDKLQWITFVGGKLQYKIGKRDFNNSPIRLCVETLEEAKAKLSHTNFATPSGGSGQAIQMVSEKIRPAAP
jgi:hypothetical protein